jgi:hypothetical protein
MSHTGAIASEIERLEAMADDIEKEAKNLVEEIEMQPQQRESPNFGAGSRTYTVYVFKPESKQIDRIRKIAANYEVWYNTANELVHIHLPNRAKEFEYYYKHTVESGFGKKTEGLFSDIRLRQSFEKPEYKSSAFASIQSQLDCQRNILNSIPEVVAIKSMDLLTVISSDLVNSEISCAEYIFKKYKTHDYCSRVAGILAGIALERHLKTRCESELGSLPNKPTLSPLIDALYTAQKITLNQKKYLEAIAATRNDCAHPTASVTRSMVGEAISNVKKHLEGSL